MRKPAKPSENGNVLVLILVILLVFAGLFFLVSQRDNHVRVPNFQKDSISTISAVQYSVAMEQGVKRLQDKKIPLDQIQFYAPIDEHFNENADEDGARLQLFHPEGGAVVYYPIDHDAVEKLTKTLGEYQNGNWHFVMIRIKGIGGDEPELVAMLYRVKQDICEKINRQLIGKQDIPVVHADSTKIFKGVYRLDGDGINGVPSQCIKADDRYIYYHVLAAQ